MRLVLDASAAVRVVMRAEGGDELFESISTARVVAAPSLYASEIASTRWKYIQAGRLDADMALERLEEAVDLIDELTSDSELATEAITEAVRYGHTVYDLLYAVLARCMGCVVLVRASTT